MLCYLRIGKRDRALRQFQKCTDILKRELDVSPRPAPSISIGKSAPATITSPRPLTGDQPALHPEPCRLVPCGNK